MLGMFEATFAIVRWGFRWFIVLAISASLAYVLTRAIAGQPSAVSVLPTVAVVRAQQSVQPLPTPDSDDACAQPLGGGARRDDRLPEMMAPPAWCGQ
jgi:hypothetical protein